jgi:putative ABC transport system permease protein
MKFNDIMGLSLNNLMHRKLRSWLTIFGIIIGVAAVVAIVSIGTGMQQSISSQLGGLGADIITVSPGFNRAVGFEEFGRGGGTGSVSQNLTIKDVQAIKSVPGIQYVDGIVSGNVHATYLAKTASLQVQGVDALAWEGMTTSQLASGRYLSPGDVNDVVIGNVVATETFNQPVLTNTQIVIEGKSFNVVGILQASGSFGRDDDTIFMPVSAARTVVTDITQDQFSSIQIKVTDPNSVGDVANTTEQRLLILRHVSSNTKDFTVTTAQAMQQRISSVMDTMDMFLTGIAAISLLVGAIGIANTMFMSVMERTRQIGVLKALGTTNTEVTKLFLTESAIMGFIGGLVGIFLGFIISGTIAELGVRMMGAGMGRGVFTTVITPELILSMLGFSVIIGAVSGLLPARRAAGLLPVEALRYE